MLDDKRDWIGYDRPEHHSDNRPYYYFAGLTTVMIGSAAIVAAIVFVTITIFRTLKQRKESRVGVSLQEAS